MKIAESYDMYAHPYPDNYYASQDLQIEEAMNEADVCQLLRIDAVQNFQIIK